MTAPRPPWDFRNEQDARSFKRWIIQQLEQAEEPTEDDLWREAHMPSDEYFSDRLKRGRVINAARERDTRVTERLTVSNPELKNLAIRELARRRSRGREKGEARPRDISAVEKELQGWALRDVELIRQICLREYGRWKGYEEIAMEIAAERNGRLDVDRLINFKKNRRRRSAS
jgi:hypothetical protein